MATRRIRHWFLAALLLLVARLQEDHFRPVNGETATGPVQTLDSDFYIHRGHCLYRETCFPGLRIGRAGGGRGPASRSDHSPCEVVVVNTTSHSVSNLQWDARCPRLFLCGRSGDPARGDRCVQRCRCPFPGRQAVLSRNPFPPYIIPDQPRVGYFPVESYHAQPTGRFVFNFFDPIWGFPGLLQVMAPGSRQPHPCASRSVRHDWATGGAYLLRDTGSADRLVRSRPDDWMSGTMKNFGDVAAFGTEEVWNDYVHGCLVQYL